MGKITLGNAHSEFEKKSAHPMASKASHERVKSCLGEVLTLNIPYTVDICKQMWASAEMMMMNHK